MTVLQPLNPTATPDNPPQPFVVQFEIGGKKRWHTFWAVDQDAARWQANLIYDDPEILKIVSLELSETIMPLDIRRKYYLKTCQK